MASKKALRFSTTIEPGESKTLTYDVEREATIEDLAIRFYQGPELTVRVRPRVIRDGQPMPLVRFQGKTYIDGDGDLWEFDISEEAGVEDTIEVEVDHVGDDDDELNLSYDIAVDMTLDREGGLLRPFESLIDRARGVF